VHHAPSLIGGLTEPNTTDRKASIFILGDFYPPQGRIPRKVAIYRGCNVVARLTGIQFSIVALHEFD
jgi:hypothetical protein